MSFETSSLPCAEGGAVSRSISSGRSEATRVQSPVYSREDPVSRLSVDCWGSGVPVVLVHGSLATGADEWQAQRPLAEEGFRLLVPDRRGYGRSPAGRGEDFLSRCRRHRRTHGRWCSPRGTFLRWPGRLVRCCPPSRCDSISDTAGASRILAGPARSGGEDTRRRCSPPLGSGSPGRGLGDPLSADCGE